MCVDCDPYTERICRCRQCGGEGCDNCHDTGVVYP